MKNINKKIMILYSKNEMQGSVHNLTTSNTFCASSEIFSKSFKSLKGAQKFMEKWGYKIDKIIEYK